MYREGNVTIPESFIHGNAEGDDRPPTWEKKTNIQLSTRRLVPWWA